MKALVGKSQICYVLRVLAVLFLSMSRGGSARAVLIPQRLCFMRIHELIVPLSVLLVPDARIICVLYEEDTV